MRRSQAEILQAVRTDMVAAAWTLDMFDIDSRTNGHSLLVTALVAFERLNILVPALILCSLFQWRGGVVN